MLKATDTIRKQLSGKLFAVVWVAAVVAVAFRTARMLPADALKWETVNYPLAGLGVCTGIVFSLPMVWILRDYLLKNEDRPWLIAFVVTFLPAIAKYIPGKVWSFLGFMLQAREMAHITNKDAVIFQIYLQIIGILSSMTLALAGALVGNFLGQQQVGSRINAGVLVLLLAGVGGLAALRKIAGRHGHVIAKQRVFHHIAALSLQKIFKGFSLVLFLSAFISVQGHVPQIMLAFIIAMQMGLLAVFSPAGIGVTEGTYVLLLSGTYPMVLAVKIAMLARIWQTLLDLACAGAGLLIKCMLKTVWHQISAKN